MSEQNPGSLNVTKSERIALPARDPGMFGVRWIDWDRLKRHIVAAAKKQFDLSGMYYTLFGVGGSGVLALVAIAPQYGWASAVTWLAVSITAVSIGVGFVTWRVDVKVVRVSLAQELDECQLLIQEIEHVLDRDALPTGSSLTLSSDRDRTGRPPFTG